MHFSTPLCMALALPILASAFGDQDDAIHVALMARQEPGTPKYVCHENCGTVLSISKKDGFCNNDKFTESLSDCLDCALEFDIWKYYEAGVTKAAEACDLDADPEPVPTKSEDPTTTSADASETAAPPSTTADSSEDDSTPEITSGSPTFTSEVIPSGTAPSGGLPSGNATTIVPPTMSSSSVPPVNTGAAAHHSVAGQGIFAVVIAGLMAL